MGAPARLPRCPLPSRSHQEDSKLALSSGSRGYLNPPWGPASPGAQRLADPSLAPPAEAGRWARFPGLEPGALSLRHASPSASPASPQPSAHARRLPPAPPRRGHQSRAPVRPSRPPQDVGTGERAARPAGAGRQAGAKPRVGPFGAGGVARAASPATYARALGKPMDKSTSRADPCLMVPGRCWRFLRGVTLLYSSSLAAMPSGVGWLY